MADKKKGQKMSLGAFLANDEYGSWADDVAELPSSSNVDYGYDSYDAPSGGRGGPRQSSPSRRDGPSARRERKGPSHPIPDQPPFNAFVGNLAFNTAEPDIDELFRELDLDTIRLIRDHSGKSKCFAYVEFNNRESLEKSLTFDGEMLNGRPVRVDVAEVKENQAAPQKRSPFGGFASGLRESIEPRDDKFANDWRSASENRPSAFGAPKRPESSGGPFGGSRPLRGPSTAREPQPAPVERKKLQLMPRVKPVESPSAYANTPTTSESPATSTKANPFGEAKPRDEAEIQRRLEQRQKEREEHEAKEREARRLKEEEEKEKKAAAEAAEAAAKETEQKKKEQGEKERNGRPSTASTTRESSGPLAGGPRRARSPHKQPNQPREPAPSIADTADNWRSKPATVQKTKYVFSGRPNNINNYKDNNQNMNKRRNNERGGERRPFSSQDDNKGGFSANINEKPFDKRNNQKTFNNRVDESKNDKPKIASVNKFELPEEDI